MKDSDDVIVEPTTNVLNVPDPFCPHCGSTSTRQGPGTSPHFARLECADCGRFLKWLRDPAKPAR